MSSQEQAIGTSLEDQQNVIRAHAEKGGMNVARMYVEAESAVHEKIERREQIRALMADARKGDIVLVDKVDRWSRDPEFTYRSMRELRERGVDVYFIGDSCDPSTPEGDTMLNFRVLFAREEHKRIKLRLVGTRKTLRNRGYYAEGLPPWGYRRQDVRGADRNALVLDEAEAVHVREAFRLCIAGKSTRDIAELLGGSHWRIRDTLRNRVCVGEIRDTSGKWAPGKHAPIVTPYVFAQAQAALDGRKRGSRVASRESETATWWLRDIAHCALCGSKMSSAYAGPHEARRHYFRCYRRCVARSPYLPVHPIEDRASPIVQAHLVELRQALATAESAPSRIVADVSAARDRIDARRTRISRQHEMGAISDEELRQRLVALDEERARIDALVLPPDPVSPAQRRAALRDVDAMRRAWARLRAEAKRRVVNSLARTCLVALGREPRFDWYSAEDLARRA